MLVPEVFTACDLAKEDRTAAVAKLHAEYGVNVFFAAGEGPDDKQSEMTLLQLHQGGLGLPDRDYYFDEDKAEKRELYVAHVERVLGLLGEPAEEAKKGAAAVMRLETALAAAHLTRTERRDPETTYNKMAVAKLAALCKGGIEWARYLELIGKKQPKGLNVDTPPALANASRVLKDATDDELRAYLRWHSAKSCSAHLPSAFVDAHFDFFSKTLSGQQEQKPRWKRCMGMVEDALGEAVGQLYVAKYFGADAKNRALASVEQVRQSLEARLREVPWMAESTRAKALEKMAAFGVKSTPVWGSNPQLADTCVFSPHALGPRARQSATPTIGSTTARCASCRATTWATCSARAPSSTAARWPSPTRRPTGAAG